MKLTNDSMALKAAGFLFGFSLPISTKLSNISIIIFCLVIIFLLLRGKIHYQKKNIKILKYSTVILIIPCILSLIFYSEPSVVLNILGRRFTYFILPLLFLFLTIDHFTELRRTTLWALVYGVFFSSIFLLINIFLNYYATRPLFLIDNELLNFYYTGFEFTKILDIHPSYFGMYVLLAISVLLFEVRQINITLKWFMFFIMTVAIFFLNARIILFLYSLIIFVFIFKSSINFFENKAKALIVFLFLGASLSFFTYQVIKETYIFQSLTKEVVWELTFNTGEKYNSKTLGDSRISRWSTVIDLIYQKPLFGYGSGNEKDILEKGFRNNNMVISANERYDSHNQFLGYAIEGGLIALFILLYYFAQNMLIFYKDGNIIYILFLLSIIGICLFENYLNNNAGIIFLAFYGNLFLYSKSLAIKN